MLGAEGLQGFVAESEIERKSQLRIGVEEIERLVSSAEAFGAIDNIQPRNLDAWRIVFPSLESLPSPVGEEQKLRICIATEEIVGPVRNGGIGTTYAYLSEMLAKIGCDTTILYLRGKDVENGTVDDWIAHYAQRGVKFVPVPNYASADKFHTGADRWLKAPYNMLRWLMDNPMDVVHVSEWHGCGYLSLLAKRQGLAFLQTLFLVKTSSPWLWNRLYGAQPLERLEDLAKITAERQSVELADMVIGGSLHLLRWMASQGYRIPRERTFVQPNLVKFDHLQALMSRRSYPPGTRLPVDEIVFFGRLEARKGLFVFCQAIKRLVRLGVKLPKTITFMGKPGARLTARPDQDILDYIDAESREWPCEINVLTNFQQYEALEYLLAEPRLAVMPSIIENSSMAVYEAAICGIPFIASAAGGTPELVAPEDHDKVLCEAHPLPLADRIAEALAKGAYVAKPSFSNEYNLGVWEKFHRDLGRGLIHDLLARSAPAQKEPGDATFSVCIYHSGDDAALRETLASLSGQEHLPLEAIVAVDAEDPAAADRAREMLQELSLPGSVVEAFDYDAGLAFNTAASAAQGEFALFVFAGVTLRAQALRALSKVARSTDSDLINFFYRVTYKEQSEHSDYLQATILGSLSESFFRTDLTAMPLSMRLSSFRAVEGFASDYRVLGGELELVARAQVKGLRCTTALMDLASVPGFEESWLRERGYDQAMSYFRVIRPHISAAPLALRDLLLMARGLQLKSHKANKAKKAQGPAATQAQPKEPVSGFGRLLSALKVDIAPARQAARASAAAKKREAAPEKSALINLLDADFEAAHPQRAGADRKLFDLASSTKRGAAPEKSALINLLDADFEAARPQRAASDRKFFDLASSTRQMLYLLPGSNREEAFSGQLYGLYKGVLYGWAKDETRPHAAVEVHLFRDGKRETVVSAAMDIPSAVPVPKDMRGHCFAIKVGSLLPVLDRFRASRLRLGVGENGALTLGEAALGAASLEAAGFEGCCDPNRHGFLHGWVWRRGQPDESVDVTVFIDDRVFTRLTASSPREDLTAAGIGRGDHAFRVQIPKLLRDGTERRITVVTAESGLLLKFGNLKLKGDVITPL